MSRTETVPSPRIEPFRVTWLEVFAERPLGGNLHVVVHEADALEDATMAALAARTRLSETSFVQSPTTEGADYRHRIFTVAAELPFAGHPSLGTAAAMARGTGATVTDFVQETGAGLQRLTVRQGDVATVEIVQNDPEYLAEPSAGPYLAAIGLAPEDEHERLRPAIVSTGLPTLVLPLGSLGALQRARPDLPALKAALDGADHCPVTCYAVWPDPGGSGHFRARCFTAQVASGEDAATGSAAGPLSSYAERHLGVGSITIDQGVELGSPSRLWGRIEDGRVVVGGHVRVLGDGTLRLPVRRG